MEKDKTVAKGFKMNIVEISCPSKTFILGEYAVLDKGPAILLNTNPRFRCFIKPISSEVHSQKNLFKDNSGKITSNFDIFKNKYLQQWMKKYSLTSQNIFLEWLNPYQGRGGFGFSSAQFNILYAYHCFLTGISIELVKPKEVWRAYRNMGFEGYLPSGSDLISQWIGGICVFKQEPLYVESYMAAFPDLDCFVLKTGEQLMTYEYLKELQLPDVSDLKQIAQNAVEAMEYSKESQFLDSIVEYGKALDKKGFVASKTKQILETISQINGVKACKGCGAMGAESIILFFDAEHRESIREQLPKLEIVCDKDQITYGVEYHKVTKMKEVQY